MMSDILYSPLFKKVAHACFKCLCWDTLLVSTTFYLQSSTQFNQHVMTVHFEVHSHNILKIHFGPSCQISMQSFAAMRMIATFFFFLFEWNLKLNLLKDGILCWKSHFYKQLPNWTILTINGVRFIYFPFSCLWIGWNVANLCLFCYHFYGKFSYIWWSKSFH